jgi:hypothetical protein
MLACCLLVLAGVVLIAMCGRLDIVPPEAEPAASPVRAAVRRYLWWATLVITSGLVSGILVAGAGGRLVMRLLAATSPDARGQVTEAEEIVGRITFGGTLSFLVFSALPLAMLAAFLFAVIHRWLPRGRLAGLTFGLLLLIAASTRIEPLRSNNPDFRLVGPAWVALLSFGLLVLADGMLVAAFMSWYSRRVPLRAHDKRELTAYLPLVLVLLLIPVGVPTLVLAAAGAGLVALVARIAPNAFRWWNSHGTKTGGRVILAGGSLLALPGFLTALSDIVP